MRRRKRSPSPQRRMRRSSGLQTCCNDRSKYGTPVSQIASISSSVRSHGYRYSRRVRPTRSLTARTSGTIEPAPSSSGRSLPYDGEVLGDEHDLAAPRARRPRARIGVDVAAALRAAERRDGAESARAVAALGDLHVGPRARALGRGRLSRSKLGIGALLTGMSRLPTGGLAAERSPARRTRRPDRPRAGPRPARRRSARPCSR